MWYVMILVTCTISSIVTERASRELAMKDEEETYRNQENIPDEKILIPVANPATIENLVNLAIMLKNAKNKSPLYALYVDVDTGNKTDTYSKSILPKVAKIASSTDTEVNMIARSDLNIASGIVHAIKENNISEVVLGFHQKANIADTFFGPTCENIIERTNKMILITKILTPVNTINKIIVAVPPKAEFETGFARWVDRIANMAVQTGCRCIFYCKPHTADRIRQLIELRKYRMRAEFETLNEWKELIALQDVVRKHDIFVIVCARHTSISYHHGFEKLPFILSKHFNFTNLLVIYPEQFANQKEFASFTDVPAMDIKNPYPNFGQYEGFFYNIRSLGGRRKK